MIQPISSTAQPVSDVEAASKVQQPDGEARGRSPKPVTDEYIPEEKREPSGRYWIGKDEDGRPKVCFDDPEKKASGKKAETCTGNTDKVDREIEKLREKQEELERRVSSETDETKVKELEKQLAQVESELRQKDNDAYRRQHTVFS